MKLQLKPWPPRHKNQWPLLIHPGFRSCQGAAFGVAGGSVGLVLWLWASHGNGEKTTAYMGIPAKHIKTKKQCHQMSAVRLHENLQQKRLFVWSISFGRFNGSSRHGWNICTSNQHANQISEISELVLSTWNHVILGELPDTQSNTFFLGVFPERKTETEFCVTCHNRMKTWRIIDTKKTNLKWSIVPVQSTRWTFFTISCTSSTKNAVPWR